MCRRGALPLVFLSFLHTRASETSWCNIFLLYADACFVSVGEVFLPGDKRMSFLAWSAPGTLAELSAEIC